MANALVKTRSAPDRDDAGQGPIGEPVAGRGFEPL
jgi:hypothetical protein